MRVNFFWHWNFASHQHTFVCVRIFTSCCVAAFFLLRTKEHLASPLLSRVFIDFLCKVWTSNQQLHLPFKVKLKKRESTPAVRYNIKRREWNKWWKKSIFFLFIKEYAMFFVRLCDAHPARLLLCFSCKAKRDLLRLELYPRRFVHKLALIPCI